MQIEDVHNVFVFAEKYKMQENKFKMKRKGLT